MDFIQDSTRTATPQAPQRSLGEELTDFYAENADDFEPNGVTPEVVARHYYDTSGTDDDYDTWANRHNIGSFIAGAPTAVETARKKAAWDAAQPESRGVLGTIGTAIGRGTMDFVSQAGHALSVADTDPTAIDTDKGILDRIGGGMVDWAEDTRAKSQALRPTKQEEAEANTPGTFEGGGLTGLKKDLLSGLESVPLSAGSAAVGAGLGAGLAIAAPVLGVGAGAAAVAGGLASLGALFFGGEYDRQVSEQMDAIKKANPNASEQEIVGKTKELAGEIAGWEAGTEVLSDLVSGAVVLGTGGLGLAAKAPIQSGVKGMLKPGMKTFLKRTASGALATVPSESGTEMLNAAMQDRALADAGLAHQGEGKAALQAFIPSLVPTLFFGLGGASYSKVRAGQVLKDINSEDIEVRARAAGEIASGIKTNAQDESLAQSWLQIAHQHIAEGKPIDVNEDIAAFAAAETRREAQSEGREIVGEGPEFSTRTVPGVRPEVSDAERMLVGDTQVTPEEVLLGQRPSRAPESVDEEVKDAFELEGFRQDQRNIVAQEEAAGRIRENNRKVAALLQQKGAGKAERMAEIARLRQENAQLSTTHPNIRNLLSDPTASRVPTSTELRRTAMEQSPAAQLVAQDQRGHAESSAIAQSEADDVALAEEWGRALEERDRLVAAKAKNAQPAPTEAELQAARDALAESWRVALGENGEDNLTTDQSSIVGANAKDGNAIDDQWEQREFERDFDGELMTRRAEIRAAHEQRKAELRATIEAEQKRVANLEGRGPRIGAEPARRLAESRKAIEDANAELAEMDRMDAELMAGQAEMGGVDEFGPAGLFAQAQEPQRTGITDTGVEQMDDTAQDVGAAMQAEARGVESFPPARLSAEERATKEKQLANLERIPGKPTPERQQNIEALRLALSETEEPGMVDDTMEAEARGVDEFGPAQQRTMEQAGGMASTGQRPTLESALKASKRKAKWGDTDDVIAQSILSMKSAKAKIPEAEAAAIRQGATTFQPLSGGASAVVIDAGPVVVRLTEESIAVPRIESQHVLQPLESGKGWEVLPKAETAGIKESDVEQMKGLLATEGLEFHDPGTDNLGRVNGRLVVIDPGSVRKAPNRSQPTATAQQRNDAGAAQAAEEIARLEKKIANLETTPKQNRNEKQETNLANLKVTLASLRAASEQAPVEAYDGQEANRDSGEGVGRGVQGEVGFVQENDNERISQAPQPGNSKGDSGLMQGSQDAIDRHVEGAYQRLVEDGTLTQEEADRISTSPTDELSEAVMTLEYEKQQARDIADAKLAAYEATVGRILKGGGIHPGQIDKSTAQWLRSKFGLGIISNNGTPLDELARVMTFDMPYLNGDAEELLAHLRDTWTSKKAIEDGYREYVGMYEEAVREAKARRDEQEGYRLGRIGVAEKTSAKAPVEEPVSTPEFTTQQEVEDLVSLIATTSKSASGPMEEPAAPKAEKKIASPEELDFNKARQAYYWVSFDPDKRAKEEQVEFARNVNSLHEKLFDLAKTEVQRNVAGEQAEKFKAEYLRKAYELLAAKGRTMSAAVTGPAKFPTEKNRRAMDAEQKKISDFLKWKERAESSAVKAVMDARTGEQKTNDEWSFVKSDIDSSMSYIHQLDTGEKRGSSRGLLVSNLANRIKTIANSGNGELLSRALDHVAKVQAEWSKPVFTDRHSIWSLRAVAEQQSVAAESVTGETVVATFDGARVVNNRDDERVRILFDSKPSDEVITALKKEGWKWSRKNGAWQRQNTTAAERSAKNIVSKFFNTVESNPADTGTAMYQTRGTQSTPTAIDIRAAFPLADSITQDGDRFVVTQGKNAFAVELVESITPDETAFRIAYKRAYDPKTDKIAGDYRTGTIRVVKGVGDNWTVKHEHYHFLEDMGLVTRFEQAVLDAAIKKADKAGTLGFAPTTPAENRSYFVQHAMEKRDFQRRTTLGRVLQKIADFIDALVNLAVRTSRGIVRDIERGKMMEREKGAKDKFRLPMLQSVFHGSPHRFDKFSLDHMGSGEGAQAFGWGLYFADDKALADHYRNKLSEDEVYYNGEKITYGSNDPFIRAVARVAHVGKDEATKYFEKERSLVSRNKNLYSFYSDVLRQIDAVDQEKAKVVKGQLYKVEIPEDSEMLHWEKPLSEQHKNVHDAMSTPKRGTKGAAGVWRDVDLFGDKMTGEDLYRALSSVFDSDKKASKILSSLGIKGIKYLDGASRGAGEGSYNYVIFDDSAIEILETYYQAKSADASINYQVRAIEQGKQFVSDIMRRPEVFSILKPLQTQLHKALKNEHFRRFFERIHDAAGTQSRAAARAAGLAKDILPSYDGGFKETVAELFSKGTVTHENLRNVSRVMSALTLSGKDPSPESGHRLTPAELDTLKNGGTVTVGDAEIKMSKAEVRLYEQARAALDKMIQDQATSTAWRSIKGVLSERDQLLWKRFADFPADAKGEMIGLLEDARTQTEEQLGNLRDDMNAEGADKQAKKLETRLENIDAAMKDVEDIFGKATKLIDAGYVPLSRFGQYRVNVTDSDGKLVYVGMYDTSREAYQDQRRLKTLFVDGETVGNVETVSKTAWEQFKGASPEALMLFAQKAGAKESELLQTYYREAVSSRSALKRLIRRKGYAGYSDDLQRILASFITSGAKKVASNYHADELAKMTQDETVPGDVRDEMSNLKKFVDDPGDAGSSFRAFAANWYMLGSLTSAAWNGTQVVTSTIPELYKHSGSVIKATTQVWNAYKSMLKKHSDLTDAQKKALARAREDGTVDAAEIHHLYIQATKRLVNKLGNGEIARKAGALLRLWGMPFAWFETTNRTATFLAAYRMGEDMGQSDPYAFAKQVVDITQGVYQKHNRMNAARSQIGGAVMTFMQYKIQTLEQISRNMKAGGQARRAAMLQLAIIAAMGGWKALPGAEDIADFFDAIMQILGGKAWLTQREIRKAVESGSTEAAGLLLERASAEAVGKFMADFTHSGISAMLPVDVSGRASMGKIVPGVKLLKPSTQYRDSEVFEMAGVPGSMIESLINASDMALHGKAGQAAMRLAPNAVQAAVKGIGIATDGEIKDSRGRKITDGTALDAIAQGVGAQPRKKAEIGGKLREGKELKFLTQQVERELVVAFADAFDMKDADKRKAALASARKRLQDWNAANPDWPIHVNQSQIMRELQNKRKTTTELALKSAPRELRRTMGEL